jgi:hypothetical protein
MATNAFSSIRKIGQPRSGLTEVLDQLPLISTQRARSADSEYQNPEGQSFVHQPLNPRLLVRQRTPTTRFMHVTSRSAHTDRGLTDVANFFSTWIG